MISDSRAEKALHYLATTDEECAAAKAEMERADYRAKVMRQTVFLHETGTVAERNAKAETHTSVMEASEVYFAAIKAYGAIANKRSTEAIVMDTWRTISANRRKG